ncbi:MAG: aminoacyl-tRNA hydrolase [Actinobacteria bacterium]|nr:MAG: aminoacyl-tRNA hydrolase [Actinomycetota bacterium]
MSQDGIKFGNWDIPEGDLEESFDTSRGPGGQHANRSATAVTLRFDLEASSLPEDVIARLTGRLGRSVVVVTASESRSQWRNRALARQRLVEILEKASKPRPKRRKTKPTRASNERRLEEKRHRSEIKKKRQTPEW